MRFFARAATPSLPSREAFALVNRPFLAVNLMRIRYYLVLRKESSRHVPQPEGVVLIVFRHRGDGLESRDDRTDDLQAHGPHELPIRRFRIESLGVFAGLIAVERRNLLVAVVKLAGQRRTKRCSRTSLSFLLRRRFIGFLVVVWHIGVCLWFVGSSES